MPRHAPSTAFTMYHFATKCAAVTFAKLWMSYHIYKSKDPS